MIALLIGLLIGLLIAPMTALMTRGAPRRAGLAALLCGALLLPLAVLAHQQSLSYGELDVRGTEVQLRLRFALADLPAVAPVDPARGAGGLAALGEALPRQLLAGLSLRSGDATCALQPGPQAAPAEADGVQVTASYRCPAEVQRLEVRLPLLELLPPGHTHLARITFEGAELAERVAQAGSASYTVERLGGGGAALRLLRLGVEHIFTGYDHIAFLIGLLLLGGSLRRLVGIVTAFTVAHSITLALAALEILSPPSRLVEALIAASIVAVASENLWALQQAAGQREKALRHRWLFTFAFGLVHGFGFADALRELHLSRGQLAAGLLSFNLGVELGQLCIVALALPLLAWLLRRPAFSARGPQLLSAVIGLLGLFWLGQRLLG
jgi:hypothetical protein